MGSTSHTVCCLWMMSLATLILPSASATDFDTSVCSPSNVRVSEPPTPLVQDWTTEIAWSDLGSRHTYFVKNYRSWNVKKETVVISQPYVTSDVRLLFNDLTQDVTVEDVSLDGASSGPTCRVVHSMVGYQYSYKDIFYLTSFNFLFQQMAASQDAVKVNKTTVRGIPATRWSACLYDYSINMTNRATFYFSDTSWMSPFQTPESSVPLRVEYFARRHNGSQVTEYNIIGDFIIFQQNPTFKPDTFITSKGLFCPNRTGESMRFPSFPDQFSLLMEVIDQDFSRIAYQEIWYDRTQHMVRWDSKRADGSDSDAHTYIFDFNVASGEDITLYTEDDTQMFGNGYAVSRGSAYTNAVRNTLGVIISRKRNQKCVKYMIDIHLMSCEEPSPLVIGDDFVTFNQKNVSMMSPATYFHSEVADIQYVGMTTVRDVECNTWIGKYFDPDAERENTVQWYFTSTQWTEATGSVVGSGAFFRMEVWKGGSLRPAVYNIMRYNPTAPDIGAFDFATCYDASNKKHFTIEFKVVNPQSFMLLGRPYLKETVVLQIASHLEVQPNRFTDVTFDYDQHKTLFMSGTLLGPSKVNGFDRREIDLIGAFDFLKGSVAASHLAILLTDPDGEPITLEGVNVVEHNFRSEFTTTTTTTAKPTSFVVPTLPPKTISWNVPTAPPTTATTTATTATSSNTMTATCHPPTPCTCPTLRSIPTSTPFVSSSVRTSRLTSLSTTRLTCPPPPPPCNCSHLAHPTTFPIPTTSCQQVKLCPPLPRCTCPAPTPCPPKEIVTCPPRSTSCSCPTSRPRVPCPTTAMALQCTPCSPCPTATACVCPSSTLHMEVSPARHLVISESPRCESDYSAGALAGGLVTALVVGLLIGFVATRFYHVFRTQAKPLISNITDNENILNIL